jgi:hypothetical protein
MMILSRTEVEVEPGNIYWQGGWSKRRCDGSRVCARLPVHRAVPLAIFEKIEPRDLAKGRELSFHHSRSSSPG